MASLQGGGYYVETSNALNAVTTYGYINLEDGTFEFHMDATGKVGLVDSSVAVVYSNLVNVKYAKYGDAPNLSFEALGK
jgi:hypothetical protein